MSLRRPEVNVQHHHRHTYTAKGILSFFNADRVETIVLPNSLTFFVNIFQIILQFLLIFY